MKKVYALFILSLILLGRLTAVPAYPHLVEKMQPNGTKITVFLKGDERVHWMESMDGYTLMYNDKKEVVFAVHDESSKLTPSDILYKGEDLEQYSLVQRKKIEEIPVKLRYSKEQIDMMLQIWKVTDDMEQSDESMYKAPVDKIQRAPVLGAKKGLVILAEFSNRSFIYTIQDFENLMNQFGYNANGNTGSVRDFFRENSYGLVDFSVTVVGPVACSGTTAYYANRTSNWAREVVRKANSLVDFSQFAVDGAVPSYHIIFAGYGDEYIDDGQQIWSHKSSHTTVILDEVRIGDVYSCSSELNGGSGTQMSNIGVVCHELTHTFGAPDYYDTDYEGGNGEFFGTGNWDLMASGAHNNNGRTPAHINMWQKIMFGWVTPIKLTSPTAVVNMPAVADSACAYWIEVNGSGERYLLENRQKIKFDANIPGNGLLIYHIHQNALSGYVSNRTHPQQVYIVCASSETNIPNSSVSSYGGVNGSGCVFPGTSNKRSFGEITTPVMFSWNGTSGTTVTGKELTNISSNVANKTVSFSFMGAELPTVYCKDSITNLPFAWNFENNEEYVNPCYNFKAVSADSGTNLNGIYMGSETGIIPRTGSSIWTFSSDSLSSNYSQYMISPCIDVNIQTKEKLVVEFWYRRTINSLESFRVGYSSTNSDTSSFTWLKTITNASSTMWKQDTVVIPADAKYVALNYLGEDGRSYLGIDALTIELANFYTSNEKSNLSKNDFLKVYPNPTSGQFNVIVSMPVTLEIFTSNCVLVEKKRVVEKSDFSLQRKGLYLLRATNVKGDVTVQKLIVK